jgi:hypothetical protein
MNMQGWKEYGLVVPACLILFWFQASFVMGQTTNKNQPETSKSGDSLAKSNPSVIKTKIFYDSLYARFNRHKFTRILYGLAFIPPQISTLPDTVQALKSENPYKKYAGKVIRRIHVLSLDPFGPTVIDTARESNTGVGNFLNKVHLQTTPFVIRKMILIRKGQKLDPFVIADQERILKSLGFIDDARVIVVPSTSPDSVDVFVVTKDVWSIGADIPTITDTRVVARIYDGNFMGLGDRVSLNFSFARMRAPFAHFDGFSYTYTNILGTFTDATLRYNYDDLKEVDIDVGVTHPFLTNNTKFAGGGDYDYEKQVYSQTNTQTLYSTYESAYVWFGRSYLIKDYKIPTRFVVLGEVSAKTYLQRPIISIDTNRGYYDVTQVLAAIAFSRNNYYLIDYFINFGKTENIPYGRLFELTMGPQWTNFYTRLYVGFTYSEGNFIKKFGYLQGRIDMGAYSTQRTIEDGSLITRLNYMSYLYFTPNKQYKIRTFVLTNYRLGFLRLHNNNDYAYLNQDLRIQNLNSDTVFQGVQSLSLYFATTIYAPWYFYGFRFAMMGLFAAGLKSDGYSNMFQTHLYTGIGIGLMIKNDNLIFPTFLISAFAYPSPAAGVPWLQLNFSSSPYYQLKDYNVGPPNTVSLSQ